MSFFIYKLCILFAYLVSVYSQALYFTQQPDAVYYAHSSVPFVIQCRSTGSEIKYRRDNVALSTTLSNGSFTRDTPVEGVDGSEEGIIWDCLSSESDGNGEIVSSSARVYWAKFVDSGSSAVETVTLWDTVSSYLPCNFFNGSLPPPVISWQKGGISIVGAKILAGSNSLLLGSSEAADGDTYRCLLDNQYGGTGGSGVPAVTSYTISLATDATFSLDPLVYPNLDFTRTIGDTIYLECVGYTQSCTWQHKVGGTWGAVPTGSSEYFGAELSVVVAADTPTEYRAFLGGVVQGVRTLTIYELPEVVSSIEGEFVEYEQQTITINCTSSGVPEPTVEMYHNSVLLGNQADKHTLTTAGDTTTLEILNLETSDGGYYTCRADNSEASSVKSGRIIVRVAGEFLHNLILIRGENNCGLEMLNEMYCKRKVHLCTEIMSDRYNSGFQWKRPNRTTVYSGIISIRHNLSTQMNLLLYILIRQFSLN